MNEIIEDIISKLQPLSVNNLCELENLIATIIMSRKRRMELKNIDILTTEVLNLLDGVGDGFTPGDYYARDRYYSDISGVKNIRINQNNLLVKVTAPSGYQLPQKICVLSTTYTVKFKKSRGFCKAVDY